MGKKKFIDKKKSATFHLLSRDSSDPNYDQGPSGDRVFVRIDNNQYSIDSFAEEEEQNHHLQQTTNFADDDSIFADASEDNDDEAVVEFRRNQIPNHSTTKPVLPDQVRKEVIELGFPDDGYNYLLHLREIKKNSAFYENTKAKLDQFQLPLDVKAYDASRVRIPGGVAAEDDEENEEVVYNVTTQVVSVRVEKVVDREVEALLEYDSDMSRFDSDVEDLEEDFVVKANRPEDGEGFSVDKKLDLVGPSKINQRKLSYQNDDDEDSSDGDEMKSEGVEVEVRPRVRRELDEQFDMLTLKEYGTESDSDYDGSEAEESEPLADKLNHTHIVKEHALNEWNLNNEKYKVPAENDASKDGELEDPAPDVIRRCAEYAEMYNAEEANDEDVILEENSDESEKWDCETIITTYSNLDNHPGKIGAPKNPRKKKLVETISEVSSTDPQVISLRGKEKLPVEFLPHSRKPLREKGKKARKEKKEKNNTSAQQRKRPLGEEPKEEKKERKAAVKEERREARKAKKELKGLYKCEAQHAQKVAAISAPSSIHLM